jgi:hypothetical protein
MADQTGNHAEILDIAAAIKRMANLLVAVDEEVNAVINMNSAHAIDWTNDTFNEDAKGDLDGTNYTHEQVSNAVGSLAAFQTLMGTHRGNLALIADKEPADLGGIG